MEKKTSREREEMGYGLKRSKNEKSIGKENQLGQMEGEEKRKGKSFFLLGKI